jgi:hypothetical protein
VTILQRRQFSSVQIKKCEVEDASNGITLPGSWSTGSKVEHISLQHFFKKESRLKTGVASEGIKLILFHRCLLISNHNTDVHS